MPRSSTSKPAARPEAARARAAEPARPEDGRRRVVIEGVSPEVDGGRFPVKRVEGESVVVEADVFADGHDVVSTVLRWRRADDAAWTETPMAALGNDRWQGAFPVAAVGRYLYTIEGWVDPFLTWRRALAKRMDAGQDVTVELAGGAELVAAAAARGSAADQRQLREWAGLLTGTQPLAVRQALALDDDLLAVVHRYPDRESATRYPRELGVWVDRVRARYSTWYEFFPRSASPDPGSHGTLADCAARLPYVADMGFDVVYLPPIHPIGTSFRKGPNNSLSPGRVDVGSPWAIGAPAGGHDAIHPALGGFDDFDRLVARAAELGMEIALDLAFQCSPDHPYVKAHPTWFRHRPDGTIQYAENPPKKYQDIYPIDFESDDWESLWAELQRVVLFWAGRGVRIFRVDNPHTKAFPFWEWLIASVRERYPDVLFLAEAFTRPKVMYRLAKLGFSQSYTYFAWRNTQDELTEYFTELTQAPVREFFRPNIWPNTPDILTEYLQFGGRPAFTIRAVLAATLGASYGIYGPAFELGEHRPREPGSEEYLDSEKYQIRRWDLDDAWSLRPLLTRLNRIRRDNPALQQDWGLRFHPTDNPSLLCFSKATADLENVMLMAVCLDPQHRQAGWVALDLEELGLDEDDPFQVHDELSNARYLWHGRRNYIELDPGAQAAHVFRIRRRALTERDFDYYL